MSSFLKVNNQTIAQNLTVGGNITVQNDQTVVRDLTVGDKLTTKDVYAIGNFYLNSHILIPPGTVIQSAASNVPEGWLTCNGASISTLSYPKLFEAIEYTYGGSGLTFNVPDMQGRVAVGSGSGLGLTSRNLAYKDGSEMHTLNINEIPNHSHTSNANGGSLGLSFSDGRNTVINTDNSTIEQNVWDSPKALEINTTGGGGPHNNMQPFLVLNYLIKY